MDGIRRSLLFVSVVLLAGTTFAASAQTGESTTTAAIVAGATATPATPPGPATPSTTNLAPTATTANPGTANPGTANPGTANPGTANPGTANQAAAATTAPAPTVPATLVPLAIDTKPVRATVTVRTSGGFVRAGGTPFTAEVPAGVIDIEIGAPGKNVRRETITINGPTTLLRWLDPAGQLLAKRWEAKTGSNPKQVAFTPDGREMWVPLLGSRGVQVFATASGALLGTITLGSKGGAVEVIFTADGTRAYVSQMETASVYEIDRIRRVVLRRFATGGNWTKVMALSADGKTLYAANWVSNDVSEIDLASGAVRRRLKTVKTPRGLVLSPDGRAMYVAGFQDGEIERIDLTTGAAATLVRTGGAMRHMVPDGRTGLLYADDMGTDQSFVVDMNTQQVRKLAATDSHPNTIDLSPDGALLFVSNRGQNGPIYTQPGPEWGSVVVLDTASGVRLDAIVAGNQTTGLDVSPDGKLLAFTDFMDNRLALYDIPPTDVLKKGGSRVAVYRAELKKR